MCSACAAVFGGILPALSHPLCKQLDSKKKKEGKNEKMSRKAVMAAADKILKYRADYNNNPPHAVAFMPAIASTSGRLHSEFIRLLFLQAHQETDRFSTSSGVQPP